MAPKRAAQRKPETEAAELPETLIAPSAAADKDREAYWINLLADVDQLKAATETTDFFVLCQEFPAAAWDRLTIYLYRLTDDAGMLIKNSDDKPHYIKVLRQPLTEEFVAKNWGGGKYQALLKIDNKEVLRKHTFRIDGDPKVLPGQRVEVEGRVVPLTGAVVPPAAPDQRSDVATIIDANSRAEEKRMEMVTEASKAAIGIVRDQAAAAAKPDATGNGIIEKFLTFAMERMMNPPPVADPVDTFIKLQGLINKQNPEPPQEKEGATEAGITLVERLTGKTVAEMMKPRAAAAEGNEYGWVAPVMSTVTSFIDRLPIILHETRIARELEFRRQIFLRTAQPGQPIPKELLETNQPPNPPAENERRQPQPAQPGAPPDVAQLTTNIIQTICHGFDTDPNMGAETAATIALLYGKQIEAIGLEAYLANEQALTEYVKGIPVLAQRSQFATWPKFQEDFLGYCLDRWGVDEGDVTQDNVERMPPLNGKAANPEPAA